MIAEKCQELAETTSIREAKDIHTWARMVKAAAKERGDCEEIIGLAAELQLRSEIRLGQFLLMMPKNKGTRGQARGSTDGSGGIITEPPEDETPTLKEMDLTKTLSARCQKLAGLSKEDQEAHVEEIKHRTVKSTEYSPDRSDDEWFTPVEIMEAVRDVLGTIDLDPASCAEAQQTVQATRYFTAENDGLKQEWAGRVWLNPPFSHPLNIHFVNKLIAEVASGRVSEAILLVNILPSAWLNDALKACSAVCFTRDRLRFTHKSGKVQTNSHVLSIFFFGPDVEKFARRFAEFGCVKSNLRADSVPSEDKAEPSGHGDEWYTPSQYIELVRDVFGG